MSKIISEEVLQNDIIIYREMLTNNNYADNLKLLDEITRALNINSLALYYRYQMVLKQLENYSYYEATILRRLEDREYRKTLNETEISPQVNQCHIYTKLPNKKL